MQKSLDISQNLLETLPDKLPLYLRLKKFHVKSNRLNALPSDLHHIEDLEVTGNPLAEIHLSFREDKDMVPFFCPTKSGANSSLQLRRFLKIAESEPMQQWDQVKLMLVGHEVCFFSLALSVASHFISLHNT
jgi:hypothetical protein